MKKLLFLVFLNAIISCSTYKQSSSLIREDQLFVTRKYIGVYMDYRPTDPRDYIGPNIFWIKTSMDNLYGKISVYGNKCEFVSGDRLYLKRTFFDPGIVSGYWVYNVENDSSVSYRATEFQHDRQVLVATWFKENSPGN